MTLLSRRISTLSVAVKVLDSEKPDLIISKFATVDIPDVNPACVIRSARYHLFVDLPHTVYTATVKVKGYRDSIVDLDISTLDRQWPVIEVLMVHE